MAARRLKAINNTLYIEQENAHVWNKMSWPGFAGLNKILQDLNADLGTLYADDNWRRIAIICARLDGNCEILYDEDMKIIPKLNVEGNYIHPSILAEDRIILLRSPDLSVLAKLETPDELTEAFDERTVEYYSLQCLGWVRINENTVVMVVEHKATPPTGDSK